MFSLYYCRVMLTNELQLAEWREPGPRRAGARNKEQRDKNHIVNKSLGR